MDHYLQYNTFLADINNERPAKNATYRQNLALLDKLVLFRFKDDVTVVPRDSAWFALYDGRRLLSMEDTALYQVCGDGLVRLLFCPSDVPGLLCNSGRLHHISCSTLPVCGGWAALQKGTWEVACVLSHCMNCAAAAGGLDRDQGAGRERQAGAEGGGRPPHALHPGLVSAPLNQSPATV